MRRMKECPWVVLSIRLLDEWRGGGEEGQMNGCGVGW